MGGQGIEVGGGEGFGAQLFGGGNEGWGDGAVVEVVEAVILQIAGCGAGDEAAVTFWRVVVGVVGCGD